MNQPNPDQLARAGNTQYDNLSDADLLTLLNDTARYKGKIGRFQPQAVPVEKKVVDLSHILGGLNG